MKSLHFKLLVLEISSLIPNVRSQAPANLLHNCINYITICHVSLGWSLILLNALTVKEEPEQEV